MATPRQRAELRPARRPKSAAFREQKGSPDQAPETVAYSSAAARAIRNERCTRNANSNAIAATPTNPHSSPIAGSTRSVWPAGIRAGIAPARAGTPQAAGRERPDRVRQLIAARYVVVPGRKPHGNARHHRRRLAQLVPDSDARHQERQTHQRQAGATSGDGEHDHEKKSGDQRRAEILQKKKHGQRAAHAAHDGQRL